jgi:hypothetical protein
MPAPEFFNPAGLDLLEDRGGAVSCGFIAPRVLYSRFVGDLSADLGMSYVQRLERLLGGVPGLAYFSDYSALNRYDCVAKARFVRFVIQHRVKFACLVMLTWSEGVSPAARTFAATVGEPVSILTDPVEFDQVLSNLAPRPRRGAAQWQDVFQLEPPSAFRS